MPTNSARHEFVTPSPALLATLGTHKRSRPLSPLEAAKELHNFFERGGRREQLPVKEDAIREFLSLLKLPETVQKMLGWRGIERSEIGMYSGSRISTLKKVEDQKALAKSAVERELNSKEVQRIVRHKLRHPKKSIDDCIETVVAMRPIKRHLFITQISKGMIKRLKREAETRKTSTDILAKEILSKELPRGSLISLNLREDFIMLLLKEEGNEALGKLAKESDTSLKDVVEVVVSRHL